MTSLNYFVFFIGFAASQTIPPDQIAIVEVSVTDPMDAITRHDRFVDALTEWAHQTQDGRQLCADLDGPATIGAILAALDSLSGPSLEFWLEKAGLYGFRVRMSNAVFDLDLPIYE